MATIREWLEAIDTLTGTEGDETQALISQALVSGDDTAISTLLSILTALTGQATASSDLLLAINGLRADMVTYDDNRTSQALALTTAVNDGFTLVDSTLQLINTKMATTITILQGTIAPPLPLIYNAILRLQSLQLALACVCDGGNPALPPPLDVTPISSLQDHCKRVQFFLDKFIDVYCGLSAQVANGLTITSSVAAALLGAGILPGVAVAAIPAALIAGAIAALGTLAAAQIDEPCQWLQAHQDDLENLLYNAGSAGDAQAAWYAYVDANTNAITELDLRIILKGIAWAGALNALYDDTNEWDTDAYSGLECGDFSGCVVLESVIAQAEGNGDGTYSGIQFPFPEVTPMGTVVSNTGTAYVTPFIWHEGDLRGYKARVISGTATWVWRYEPLNSTGQFFITPIPLGPGYTDIPVYGGFALLNANQDTSPFSVEICKIEP